MQRVKERKEIYYWKESLKNEWRQEWELCCVSFYVVATISFLFGRAIDRKYRAHKKIQLSHGDLET